MFLKTPSRDARRTSWNILCARLTAALLVCMALPACSKPPAPLPEASPAKSVYAECSGTDSPQTAQAAAGRLKLELTASAKTYVLGSDIDLSVTVVNTGFFPWTIFPGFAPEHHVPPGYPASELSFLVEDDQGARVPYTGFSEELREPASVHAFSPLSCGAFTGIRLSITRGEFAYAIRRVGTYRVKARLRHSGRRWVEEQLLHKAFRPSDLIYDIGSVYEGTLESNSLTFTILPPGH